ncbi:aminotransferase class IV [uncultured Sunxiuqinia sp.]|uniref:aminotransferase class IV n=1 Tax=uncultured Sunxiuqinia sp. TaxID=1573825 RepID=UPI002AA87AE4|nr:aminotransferase class IV [uncultured Sunxiuqinia sp.]
MIGFDNGVFRELAEISIPITSLSINRSYGAFEFLEVINGNPFYGDRHLKRFLKTMAILKLTTNFDDQLKWILDELIERNNLTSSFVKLFVLPHEVKFDGIYQAALYVFPTQMPDYPTSFYTDGVRLVMKQYQRFLPEAKSTNYLAGQYWMNEQTDQRVTDILFHNGETVQETSRGNVFAVINGNVITPSENVLDGVTRRVVIELLKEQCIPFKETELSIETLLAADEVFLASTTKHIMPVTTIDDRTIADGEPGKFSKKVMQVFQHHCRNYGLNG